MTNYRPAIFYDGQCNFCLAIIKFIFSVDKKNQFDFYPLQSKKARGILRNYGVNIISLNTLYFAGNENEIWKKSKAVFEVFSLLPFPFMAVSYLSFLPASITDKIYDLIARFRYRIFGKSDQVIFPDKINLTAGKNNKN